MGTRQRVGIVGGLGPYAGLDLVRKIFDRTRGDQDQDHIRVMLHSFPGDIPVRPQFLLGLTDVNPGVNIGEIMAELAEGGATILCMPCNTAHSPRILDVALERLKATGREVRFVHIIEAAVERIARDCKPGARVGLLATFATLETRLYQDALEAAGFVPVLLDEEGRALVQEAISNREYGIKASCSPVPPKAREILLAAVRKLVEKGVDIVLLGCTEIPLAVTESELYGTPVVDATGILAEAVIRAYDPAKLKD